MKYLKFVVLLLLVVNTIFAAEELKARIRLAITPCQPYYNKKFYFKVIDDTLRQYVEGADYVTIIPTTYIDTLALMEGREPELTKAVIRNTSGMGWGFDITDESLTQLQEISEQEYNQYYSEAGQKFYNEIKAAAHTPSNNKQEKSWGKRAVWPHKEPSID